MIPIINKKLCQADFIQIFFKVCISIWKESFKTKNSIFEVVKKKREMKWNERIRNKPLNDS